jgi:hypothetical protein
MPEMDDRIEKMAEPELGQVKIVLNSLYLCIEYAMKHVAEHEGAGAASGLKKKMVTALKHGDIDMALLEDARTFDFVVPKIEQLAWDDPITERQD